MNSAKTAPKIPFAIYALMVGAFGIGTTEFVIMGLLKEVSQDLGIGLSTAGMLISGYALGVAVGAPIFSVLFAKIPKKTALIVLMAIFTIGNVICAISGSYDILMLARIVTAFAHGTFFGIGAVVATRLVKPDQKALAIALMFTGLTVANIVGVPFGTWLGQLLGWRATFWAVSAVGPLAILALIMFVPKDHDTSQVLVKKELRAVAKPQVLLGLLMTILGFSGVFALFTYIAPFLTTLTLFPDAWISPILLIFGLGLVFGNIVGGKFADKNINKTLLGSLVALVLVLVAFSLFSHNQVATVILVGLLGFTGFATVPPLQMKVLESAGEAPTLASAFNIAAFNVGNALGAWAGGVTIDLGWGLNAIPLVAAGITGLSILVALWSFRVRA